MEYIDSNVLKVNVGLRRGEKFIANGDDSRFSSHVYAGAFVQLKELSRVLEML